MVYMGTEDYSFNHCKDMNEDAKHRKRGDQDHSRLSTMAPFDRAQRSS